MNEEKTTSAKSGPPASHTVDNDAGRVTLSRTQITTLTVLLAGYAGLSFYSDSMPAAANLATSLSLAPILLIALALLWRWTHSAVTAVVGLATAIVLYRYWGVLRDHYQWSNLVQQAGAFALLAIAFARSLSRGVVPLCTQLADRLYGPLTDREAAYTRKATMAWAFFYFLLTLTIIVVFFVASQRTWSFFVNFATFGLIGLMFAVEHTVRRRLNPQMRRGSTLSALRQFLIG